MDNVLYAIFGSVFLGLAALLVYSVVDDYLAGKRQVKSDEELVERLEALWKQS